MVNISLSEQEKAEAADWRKEKNIVFPQDILRDPKLFDIITVNELDKKISGELGTRKALFLSLCSIWVEDVQINTLVNSESSAGKSYVCNAILDLFPENLVQRRSKITPEAFTYWHDSRHEPGWTWNGVICYLEDTAQRVIESSTFKVMCSEGMISTVVINQQAVDIRINGKPCMLLTTASANPSKEILNRFNTIGLDESESQTENVLQKTAEFEENNSSICYDSNVLEALKLLQRVPVVIPFATSLVKHFPKTDLRIRRDFKRFCQLIKTGCALHQFQRKTDNRGNYLATYDDYELAREALRSMQSDFPLGLTHGLRKAYEMCRNMVNTSDHSNGFTVKEIYASYPIYSERHWYTIINKLCQHKLLKSNLVKIEGSDKQVTLYLPIANSFISLPTAKDLEKNNSNASIPSNTSAANEANEQDDLKITEEQVRNEY